MHDRSRVYPPFNSGLLVPDLLITILRGLVPTSVRLLLTRVRVCRGKEKPICSSFVLFSLLRVGLIGCRREFYPRVCLHCHFPETV